MMELQTLTVPEAAKVLRVSPNTLKKYLQAGQVPGIKIGGQWRISRELLLRYLAGQWRPDESAGQQRPEVVSG